MELYGILAKVSTFALTENTIELDFIARYISWLIKITSSVGLGIILFTLTLRMIVLPFDIFSKVKMRKNSIAMREMRPELEKLQKQYANDKNLYNQKMLALQKKNGYSPLSGCLPMILSLVIFIIAINSFRQYSAFSMQEEYNDIIIHYNAAVLTVTDEQNENSVFKNVDDEVVVDSAEFYKKIDEIYSEYSGYKSVVKLDENNALKLSVDNDNKFTDTSSTAFIDNIKYGLGIYKDYFITDDGQYKLDLRASNTEDREKEKQSILNTIVSFVENNYINEYIVPEINKIVKEDYETDKIKKSSFLWVKNIWLPDVSYEHPIVDTAESFQTKISNAARQSCTCSCEVTKIPIDETVYNTVTAGLDKQKTQANGYFIMIVLSILTTFLSQFIAQRQQKDQLELQSVDGQAAMTQKMMMWIMPIMFGFFAFSYSTAFSIYMTVSSIITTLSSVLVNGFTEKKNETKKEKEANHSSRSKKNINKIEKEKAIAEVEEKKKQEEKKSKKNKGK